MATIEQLRKDADHPDTDCVAYVDEVVPALLDIAEAAAAYVPNCYSTDKFDALANALERLGLV